jgi:hypothetical protein
LWNSKRIEKAAVLSPNLVDYLLVLISKFKVLAMIFNQSTIVSSILYSYRSDDCQTLLKVFMPNVV